ncbi:hypothetical protein PL321_05380 [Caloramator sp. mosi_1]|uniref:hypothetical protein n=1 Tax=Caloramator sp. mosi_1 TaxID=3023090 RepID=UPI0023608BDD|nr:hypothetical protein [Caloramator sp. mosi_1]WDC84981.1 hypothetical protein PL321_05380 [Caloramator sp. mosi_1]
MILSGINFVSKGYISSRFSTIFKEAKQFFTKQESNFIDNLPLSISSSDKKLKFIYPDGIIEFDVNQNLIIYDENRDIIKYEYDSTTGKLKLFGRYSDKHFVYGIYKGMNMIILEDSGYNIQFVLKGDKFEILISDNVTRPISEIEAIGFKGKERLGSSRAYIWSRTLPLIKNIHYLERG